MENYVYPNYRVFVKIGIVLIAGPLYVTYFGKGTIKETVGASVLFYAILDSGYITKEDFRQRLRNESRDWIEYLRRIYFQ